MLPAYRAISSNEPSIRYKWSEVEGSGLLGIMGEFCNGSITIESANKDWCECAPKRTVATSAQIDCGIGCIELIGPDYDAITSLVRKFPYKTNLNVQSDSPTRKSVLGFPCGKPTCQTVLYQRSFQHTSLQISTKSTFLDIRAMKKTDIKAKKEKLLLKGKQNLKASQTQTRNATDHWQKIYIRVLQSVSPDTTSMITNPDRSEFTIKRVE